MDYLTASPEELVLACTKTSDAAAWAEFIHRFHRLISTAVLRVARQWGDVSPSLVDDLVQETYLKLCADNCTLLARFSAKSEGSIFAYIQVLTANLVHDHFKGHNAQKRGGRTETVSLEGDLPTAAKQAHGNSLGPAERGLFIQQVDAIVRSLGQTDQSERDRRIFWLYYRVGLSASAIATLPSITLSTKGVESTILRVTRQVRERVLTKASSTSQVGKSCEGIRPADSL